MTKRRSLPLSAIVLALVAALALGTVGSATAAEITKKTVKKIAAKVVKKQAPSLTVASAATATNATNATNLAGQPASAYQGTTYRYAITPAPASSSTKTFTFSGLPAGTYTVSYSVLGTMAAANTSLQCYFNLPGTTTLYGLTYGYTYNSFSTATNTFSATWASGSPQLECVSFNLSNWNVYTATSAASTVTFTRTEGSVTGPPPAVAGQPSGSGTGGGLTAR